MNVNDSRLEDLISVGPAIRTDSAMLGISSVAEPATTRASSSTQRVLSQDPQRTGCVRFRHLPCGWRASAKPELAT